MPQNKEYIEREEALKQIFLEATGHNFDFNAEHREIYLSAKRAIKNIPTADVMEVRHGRWENGECSNCKFDLRELTDGENDLEQWVWDEGFDYCPHCGTLMDKEE